MHACGGSESVPLRELQLYIGARLTGSAAIGSGFQLCIGARLTGSAALGSGAQYSD